MLPFHCPPLISRQPLFFSPFKKSADTIEITLPCSTLCVLRLPFFSPRGKNFREKIGTRKRIYICINLFLLLRSMKKFFNLLIYLFIYFFKVSSKRSTQSRNIPSCLNHVAIYPRMPSVGEINLPFPRSFLKYLQFRYLFLDDPWRFIIS